MHEKPDTNLPVSGEVKTMPLAFEDFTVSRRRIAGDVMRLSTRTQTQERLVDEEVTHEQVTMERVPIGRVVDVVPDIQIEGDLTIVPVMKEEVVVQRRLVLVEEIHLRRIQIIERHSETVKLRRQVVDVTQIQAAKPNNMTTSAIPKPEQHLIMNTGTTVMPEETIVAVYDTAAHAEAAIEGLKNGGVPAEAITTHAENGGPSGMTGPAEATPVREQSFWCRLFGGEPDHDTAVYDRSLQGGATVVSVKTPESHIDRVMEILESQHPIDIDDRAASYGLTQTTTTTRQPLASPTRSVGDAGLDSAVQLSEETLAVGKRVVNRGTTRIRRFVVETPVEQNITLHDENVILERHPVDDGRPVTDGCHRQDHRDDRVY